MRIARFALLAVLAISGVCGCSMPPAVKVMSFNIRYGTAADGENEWARRRDFVIETIRANAPDVISMQEVLAFQADELCEALPEYEYAGVGRDDGARAGEAVPIMYRRELLKPVDGGHVWLSPEPDQPGLRGWDAACPRMVTWLRLGFRKYPLNSFYIFNTHFDHRGKQARLESAKLLRRMTDALGGKPIVVTGDFNCGRGSPPYEVLTADNRNLAELTDTYAALELPEDGAGTFNGFAGRTDGPRIDWILTNRRFEVLDATIDRRAFDGHYPSDHFPVTATIRLMAATSSGAM